MAFDWILFLSISVIGPIFGGRMCTVLEKKLTGDVRLEIEFKKKKMRSALISIAVSYLITVRITGIISENISQNLDLLMRLIFIIIGVIIYLILQTAIYRVLLGRYKK